jgi:hypothetical protein
VVTIPAALKQIGDVLGNCFIQLVTICAALKQIGDVLGNFFIQLVTIRAALKQIENFNVIKMKKNKKYHTAETILKSSLGVYGV